MSRDKFEEWAKVRGHPLCDVVPKYGPASSMPQSEYRFSDIAYGAWLAGRESMRDEAAERCMKVEADEDYRICIDTDTAVALCLEIKNIEP